MNGEASLKIKGYELAEEGALRLFILLTLFFPAFYSFLSYEEGGEYFAGFSVAYGVLAVFLILKLLKGRKESDTRFFWVLLGGLVIYNLLPLYYNIRYLHWYGEQVNNTAAILFFAVLIRYGGFSGEQGRKRIRFLLACIIFSNLLSILYFLLGYTSFVICNNRLVFYRLPEDYYEFRHYWLYSHKSDYALQLVMFLAVFLRFRKLVERKWIWAGGMGILLVALGLTHSWTSVVSAACVLVGAVMEKIDWKEIRKKKQYLWGGVGAAAAAGLLLAVLAKERNLSNFGSRPAIWHGALRAIRENPMGLGKQFSFYPIEVVGEGWTTNNAHNVFLNALLRCSVPVGICFAVLILAILVFCMVKGKWKWLSLGMWGAAMLLLNMDYALLNYELAMFLLCAYLVCICDCGETGIEGEKESNVSK